MAERKFTLGLNKPGMAAQLRETVSQVVRESAVLVSVYQLFNKKKISFIIEKWKQSGAGRSINSKSILICLFVYVIDLMN